VPETGDAEPLFAAGDRTGVLLVHGFTGCPASMRPWGHHLAAAEGLTVAVPRLPGHGTTWQELNATSWTQWYAEADHHLTTLRSRCDEVFICGLSMGGCLALRLAECRPDDVAGVVLVNPSIASSDVRLHALPLLKHVVPAVRGIGSDIKKAGVAERGYDRTPLKALDSLRHLWKVTREDLPKVTAPLLVFRSAEDHVVEPLSTQIILEHVSSPDVAERVLENSYHVATLDHDAPTIPTESAQFIRERSRAPL
jgi:carboxylesterase